MKKLLIVVLLGALMLPACEKKKHDVEMSFPSEPPNLENFRPAQSPQ